MEYHRAHSNSLRLTHDVGSGSGVFATKLAEYFQHVHVSDSNATFVKQAKQRLDKWFAEHWWKAKFTFSVTSAENADEVAARESVDLVTLMQCAHWMDQEAMVKSVGASLAPNGTLAVVLIRPVPTVIGNESVNAAVQRLFAFWGKSVAAAAGGKEALMWQRYLPQGNAGTECIRLPDPTFIQDVTKRIEINVQGRGRAPHAIRGLEDLVAPSQANSQHRRYEYTSEDPEGEGWRYDVKANWFRGLIGTLEQESRLRLYDEYLEEIERLVDETSPGGTVTVEWTVSLLLATRK